MNREHIRTLVQEEFKHKILNSQNTRSSKNDLNKHLLEKAQTTGMILEENVISMIASVIDWFKDHKEDEVKFKVLTHRYEPTFIYVAEIANKIEAIEYDERNNIIDQRELQSVSDFNQYIQSKKEEGYVDAERIQQIKKAIRILLYGIGIALIAGGVGTVLGPSILVVGGWIFDIIGFIGSSLWAALSWVGGGIGGIGDGAVGYAAKETLKGVGILSITAIGGWTTIKLARKIDNEPQEEELSYNYS